ncbi:hypothetical protein HMSSN036_18440 [Paenibacillus macerans]|nr:hypothetical protein HMSSN036_18440 [Paenibacillus macerans]
MRTGIAAVGVNRLHRRQKIAVKRGRDRNAPVVPDAPLSTGVSYTYTFSRQSGP